MDIIPIEQLENYLADMKHWFIEGSTITKNYVFPNFKDAINFVNKIADLAEKENHHPDIKIFNYRNVTISLSTHSVGGVTEKDIKFAKSVDSLY